MAAPAVRRRSATASRAAVPGRELVAGDVVLCSEAGNYVPADLQPDPRRQPQVEEASLAWRVRPPSTKRPGAVLEQDIPARATASNTAFMGTVVTYGRGKGLVTARG